MTDEFCNWSAQSLLDHYQRRLVSPVQVMEQALRRIEHTQPKVNAFCLVDAEKGMEMARQSERRWQRGVPIGLLDGIPVAIKDTSVVQSWPTRFGSLSQGQAADSSEDLPIVARLREAGALFFCKTTTPEFAWKGVTDCALTGVTRNPWNLDKTPGGSSGGSAVAVALGIAPLATGADGGGSLRIPASFTGIYGLKPTFGLVPSFPSPLGELAVVGPLSRHVADTALMMQVITQPDSRDSYAAPYQERNYLGAVGKGVKNLRIGVSLNLGFEQTPTQEISDAVLECASIYEAMGARVQHVDLDLSDMRETFCALWAVSFTEILGRLSPDDLPQVEEALREQISLAQALTGLDIQRSHRMRRVLSTRLQKFFTQYDLLLTPTTPIPAFSAGLLTPDSARYPQWWDWTPYTWPFNLSRNPAASCPFGLTKTGLPIGIQLVGKWFDEATVLQASHALESVRSFPQPPAL